MNGNEKTVTNKETGEVKSKTFDKANRMTSLVDRGGTQSWKYPLNSDKLTSFTFTQGDFSQSNTFEYNPSDENTNVKDGSNTYKFDYDERGHIRTFTSGDNSGATYNYDDRGLLKDLTIGISNGDTILSESYDYDANGNRIAIHYPDKQTVMYDYDGLNELTNVVLKDGTTFTYGYDGFGNRTQVKKVTADGQTSIIDAKYNSENEITQYGDESIKYDANGNRIEDGKYSYEWNEKDQLVSIIKKGENTPFVTYSYDEDGKRIQKNVNGTVTNYHYDGDGINVLYETDAQNNVVRSYTYSANGQLLSMKKGSKTYFYHFNAHGDVVSITDSSGSIVATYDYDAWGNPTKVEEKDEVKDNPFRYAGYQYDQETGLYYLLARYYQPQQGVFLSLDPSPGQDNDFITQNGYTYAGNNPIKYIDPDGSMFRSIEEEGLESGSIADGQYRMGRGGAAAGGRSYSSRTTPKGINKTNPLAKIKYTDKVKSQMSKGDYHSFPRSVEAFGKNGKTTKFKGGDGVTRTKVEIKGSYKGKKGVFEFIIEPDCFLQAESAEKCSEIYIGLQRFVLH
ncbi:RHS repeat-associated core domain-containing protein [Margalitia sp. FSL K6-0131]|uniref:RHS repeat domain-containing protein n=1 Tax=Margalitia sp. FSL K6-0131 TaxID=2954604 RepID=UPI0030F878E5